MEKFAWGLAHGRPDPDVVSAFMNQQPASAAGETSLSSSPMMQFASRLVSGQIDLNELNRILNQPDRDDAGAGLYRVTEGRAE